MVPAYLSTMPTSATPRVVVIGSGFGGLPCARALAGTSTRVTVVDRHNYHLFTPLLYQVASSLVNPSDIAYPIRTVFRDAENVTFHLAEVTGIDFDRNVVRTEDGEAIPYDHVVLACGSTTNYFGNRNIQEQALGLKDLPEALELRNHALLAFEHAAIAETPDERQRWLTFVIVGAGPTGVEYAGALSELVRLEMVKDYHGLTAKDVRIILIEGKDRVLPAFDPYLGHDAEKQLKKHGVEVRLGTRVEQVDVHTVRLSGDERIEAGTFVWAAGVEAGPLARTSGIPRTETGRIHVDECLRIAGRENAWAIGDAAGVVDNGEELPMLAPPAMQQGRHVALNVRRVIGGEAPRPFKYTDKGTLATIGRNAAVAQVGKLKVTGFLGWVTWLVVHLYYIIGFRNRLSVLLRWAWNYVFYDRPIRFIWWSGWPWEKEE